MSKQQRVEQANRAIEIIASHGRKFFSMCAEGRDFEPNRISRFEIRKGRLWFIDKYTEKAIYVAYRRGSWRRFSDGGTLRSLVENMADWITGKRPEFPLNHFGPWPDWYCGGDLWGYGDDMAVVREKVNEVLSPKSGIGHPQGQP
jgi:hypothetical protein